MTQTNNSKTMEKIVSLCKRRGFIFPSSEIYGGFAAVYDYGPLGVELKNNIKRAWWNNFVVKRTDVIGVDASVIMHPKVWEASGHLENFTDPLVDCKECQKRFRADNFIEDKLDYPFVEIDGDFKNVITRGDSSLIYRFAENKNSDDNFIDKEDPFVKFVNKYNLGQYNKVAQCLGGLLQQYDVSSKIPDNSEVLSFLIDVMDLRCPECGSKLTNVRQFNLMFKTFAGSVVDESCEVYLRPETAGGIFVNFKNILNSMRMRVPFGIAQIGKTFRNEITTENYIFRTREFEQMEIEYFIHPDNWTEYFDEWLSLTKEWCKFLGIKEKNLILHEIEEKERAFYSKRTVDFEFRFPFGRKELYGLAYRTDYDLKQHQKMSGEDLTYIDPLTKEKYIPHVIEPSLGVDRSVLAILVEAYTEIGGGRTTTTESIKDIEVVLRLPYSLAPIKVAILPLSKKESLQKLASEIQQDLAAEWTTQYDETGSIGKRYRRQDEIGTPYCVTVDFDSLEDSQVTVRDRDTMEQERVGVGELKDYLEEKLKQCRRIC